MDDRELLQAVATGDEEAFTQLYARYAPAVAAFATMRAIAPEDLGEVVGKVWLACWLSASSFRGESSVKTWLFGITARQVAQQNRALARRHSREVLVYDAPETPSDDEPLEAALASATRDELATAVRGLPAHLYETVVLAWVEELPQAEIGRLLGIPVGTVKSRISTARAHVALHLHSHTKGGA